MDDRRRALPAAQSNNLRPSSVVHRSSFAALTLTFDKGIRAFSGTIAALLIYLFSPPFDCRGADLYSQRPSQAERIPEKGRRHPGRR
jgi:hypothetical protein